MHVYEEGEKQKSKGKNREIHMHNRKEADPAYDMLGNS